MREKVHYSAYTYWSSVLNVKRYTSNLGITCYDGYYIHSSGYGVRLYSDDGYGRRSPHTSLHMNFGSRNYSKTINRLYTDRGLKLLCARFVTDVLSGKIEKLIQQQQKGQRAYDVLKK